MATAVANALREILGANANLRAAWSVLEGRNMNVEIRLVSEKGRTLDSQTFSFGKNVRGELAKLGTPVRWTDEAAYGEFVTRCALALRVSQNRGHKFIHRSGYAVAFLGAKGAKVADAANEVAKNKNLRVKARKAIAGS